MAENNDGPAFPLGGFDGIGFVTRSEGMTLRDWFAGQALPSIIARWGGLSGGAPDAIAKHAYEIADAMLAERAKAEGR